jgi:two-component system, cell cycle sensor histidine kinase and response regulator CckA
VHTILLVEDEIFVRQATAAALTSSGYAVLSAANGSQALEACRNASRPLDLLLSDVVLPGMRVDELAKGFRAMNPPGRILLMSGYVEELTPCARFSSDSPYLRKPFTVSTLIKVVSDLLQADGLALEASAGKI